MTRLETWFFKAIVKKEVKQGGHYAKVLNLYSVISKAARVEFTEDNKPQLRAFLIEAHRESLEDSAK